MAKTTLICDVEYNPELTDPEGLASAMDRLMETALSTPGIMEEYGTPQVGEFYVMGSRQYAIYCLATDELMTETYGRFTRRDVAQQCIEDADPRIADDLVLVSILGIPDALDYDQPDDDMNVQEVEGKLENPAGPAEPENEFLHIQDRFECPGCKSHRMEEIMTGVIVASQVGGVGFDGDVEYGEQSNEDGVIERYQCLDCGWIVPGVRDAEALFNWLRGPNRDMTPFEGGAEKEDGAS